MKNAKNNPKNTSSNWYSPYSSPEEYFKKRIPQGYNKFIAYVEELRRNERFKRDFKKIVKMFQDGTDEKIRDKAIFKFLAKYNIHWGTFEGLGYIKEGERFNWGWLFPNIHNHDMCFVKDVYGLSYKKWRINKKGERVKNMDLDVISFIETTKNAELVEESFRRLYPVAIFIHRFASKRDVLDYVEKEWHRIEYLLAFYRDKKYKPKRRKFNQELIDCIWKNRNLPAKQIKKIIDKKFPHNQLVYYQISKIISLEKKKRTRKIS